MQPISRTAALLESNGRRKKVEISVKRRFIRDWNDPFNWIEIQRFPTDAQIYTDYKFEIIQHDLHLAFAPGLKDLPFLRIGDPLSDGIWVLWFVGWDDFTPNNPITPQLLDRGEGYVEWRLDETTRFRVEILGHLIRKLIIVERRPVWNRLRFRLGRANALLVDGAGVGVSQKRLLAFRKSASWQDNPIFWFSEPKAWDSQADIPATVEPDYILTPITDALWDMEIALDPEWLDNAQYPVYIDPTIILQPDATEGLDARLIALAPNNNYGSDTWITAYHYSSNIQNAVIQFDLSPIPTGSIINSAELYLSCVDTGDGLHYITYPHRVLAANTTAIWDESQVTWNNRLTGVSWTNPGGDYGVTYADEGEATYGDTSLETASLVQDWVDGVIPNYGYHLRDDIDWGAEMGTDSGGVFYSSDYSNSVKHPKLTIDYTEGGGIFIPAKIGAIAGKGILEQISK